MPAKSGPRSFVSRIQKPAAEKSKAAEPEIAPLTIQPLGKHEHVEKYFGVGARTVDRFIHEGLPVIRLGGTVRFDMESVRAWAMQKQIREVKSEEKKEA